jgi:hypothetical protein
MQRRIWWLSGVWIGGYSPKEAGGSPTWSPRWPDAYTITAGSDTSAAAAAGTCDAGFAEEAIYEEVLCLRL